MAERFTLAVEPRQILGKHVRHLRKDGLTPANISGGAKPSTAVQISAAELTRLLKRHGAGVLYLQMGSEKSAETALLGRVERDPVTTSILHVDFRRVRLNQPIHTHVPIHLTGEAPAVKVEGGVLLHLLDSIEIESLPTNIPEAVTLDISSLEELNSTLTVASIPLPPKVTLISPGSEPVVSVKPPRIEVEEPEVAAAAEGAEGAAPETGTPAEPAGEEPTTES
ncbi:MAG TPA: 50S ribosomal protein L25 [Ktedonobacterales bacterium]